LELQNDLVEAQAEENNALADYNKALSQLAFSRGDILQALGVKLEIK
jgi:hypothetical protein